MNTTAKVLSIVGGVVGVIAVTVGAVLGIQALRQPAAAPAQPMAQVVAVNPNFVAVKKTTQSCKTVQNVTYAQANNEMPVAGTVMGGVAGGLAGSLVKGKNQALAVGAGAVLGAATGATIQHNREQKLQPQVQESLHCTPKTTTSQVQKGFQVAYLYNGQQSVVVMDNAPPVNSTVPLASLTATPSQMPGNNAMSTSTSGYNTTPAQ